MLVEPEGWLVQASGLGRGGIGVYQNNPLPLGSTVTVKASGHSSGGCGTQRVCLPLVYAACVLLICVLKLPADS